MSRETTGRPGGCARPDGSSARAAQDQVRRLFDAKATHWAAKYAPNGQLVSRRGRLLAAVSCYAGPGDRVLDLGCGTGDLAAALAAAGMRTMGCDIAARMLSRVPRDPAGQAGWVRLDPHWRTLPLRAGAFDAVVAASVLEYVAEPAVVLRECARVLRPGGTMVCTVPDLRHPVRWLEGAVQIVTSTGLLRGRRGGFSRWDSYQAYLRASRNRHRMAWWLAAAQQAGLSPVACPAGDGRSPLLLLAFRRAALI